jgi:hypothetical protein
LKIVEILNSALELVASGPSKIAIDPDMPASYPANGIMKVPLLILSKIILVLIRVKLDFEVSSINL